MSIPQKTKEILPKTILVVGVGGTGCEVLRRFRFLLPEVYLRQNRLLPKVVIIDHDSVERKNIFRQDFTYEDIDEYKVIVLKERYKDYLDIEAIPEVLNRDTIPLILEDYIDRNFCMISAVDHAQSAALIYKFLKENAPDDIVWSFIYGGGKVVQEKGIDTFSSTTFLYVEQNKVPLCPDLSIRTKNLRNPGSILGLRRDGRPGCGTDPQYDGIQTSLMNCATAAQISTAFELLYGQGYALEVQEMKYFGESSTSTPKKVFKKEPLSSSGSHLLYLYTEVEYKDHYEDE